MLPTHNQRRLDLALVIFFALVIGFPTFCSLCGIRSGGLIDEYRVLGEFPGFGSDMETLQHFNKDLERFYNDHFGGRDLLIAGHLRIERGLFPKTGGGVLVGKEGWLYTLDNNMLDNYFGVSKLTIRQLKYRQQEIEEHRDALAARGIKYLFVVSPNKESVYPNYLPDWVRVSGRRTWTDQFLDYMRLHSTVEILDLRPVLGAASKRAPVFYETDSHWNLMGAQAACESIVAELGMGNPGLYLKSPTYLEMSRTNGTGGDIARFAGMLSAVESNLYKFDRKGPLLGATLFWGTNQMDPERFAMLPVPDCALITATNRQSIGRAVIFGDSFSFGLAPFLSNHFSEINVIRKSFNLEDVDRIKPDVVIDEKLERWLHASFYHG